MLDHDDIEQNHLFYAIYSDKKPGLSLFKLQNFKSWPLNCAPDIAIKQSFLVIRLTLLFLPVTVSCSGWIQFHDDSVQI